MASPLPDIFGERGEASFIYLIIDELLSKLYNYQIFMRWRPYREPRIQITVAIGSEKTKKGNQAMTVVTTAMPSRSESISPVPSGRSVLRQRPIERVAPFRHAAIAAATWVVGNCTVEGQPLVKQFPTENYKLHHLIVDMVEEKFALPGIEELVLPFPATPSSILAVVVRDYGLEGSLVWPAYAGVGVTRRDHVATVQLFKENLHFHDRQTVQHYRSLIATS